MKILMVCMGNICRSPMMEGWLADAIALEPRLAGKVQVDSAAIGPWHVGNPPDPRAIATAARHGIHVATQRARQLRRGDFSDFDLLLFADADTLRDGRALAGGHGDTTSDRYLAWAGVDGALDLADPYYGDEAGFEAVWRRVVEGGEGVMRRLLREGAA